MHAETVAALSRPATAGDSSARIALLEERVQQARDAEMAALSQLSTATGTLQVPSSTPLTAGTHCGARAAAG
jgi:hypothetical protein